MQRVYKNEEEVKKILKVDSLKNIKKDKIFELMHMANEIDKETYLSVIDQIPNFLEFAKEFTENANNIVQSSEKLSVKSKDMLNKISDELFNLLNKEDIDKDDKRYIYDLINKLIDTINECDKEDKKHLREMMKMTLGFCIAIAGTVFGIKKLID